MAGLAVGPGSAFFPSFLSQPPFLAPQGALVIVLVNSKAKDKTSPMEQVQLAPSKKGRSWKDRQNDHSFSEPRLPKQNKGMPLIGVVATTKKESFLRICLRGNFRKKYTVPLAMVRSEICFPLIERKDL